MNPASTRPVLQSGYAQKIGTPIFIDIISVR